MNNGAPGIPVRVHSPRQRRIHGIGDALGKLVQAVLIRWDRLIDGLERTAEASAGDQRGDVTAVRIQNAGSWGGSNVGRELVLGLAHHQRCLSTQKQRDAPVILFQCLNAGVSRKLLQRVVQLGVHDRIARPGGIGLLSAVVGFDQAGQMIDGLYMGGNLLPRIALNARLESRRTELKVLASSVAWSITDRRVVVSLGLVASAENPAKRLLMALGMPVVPLAEKFGSTETRLELNWSKCPRTGSSAAVRPSRRIHSGKSPAATTTALDELSIAAPRSWRAYPGVEALPIFS